MLPFHRVQSLRKKPLQHLYPARSLFLTGICSCAISIVGIFLQGYIPWAAEWISAPAWLSMSGKGKPASLWCSAWAADESLLQCLEHSTSTLLPSPLHFFLSQLLCGDWFYFCLVFGLLLFVSLFDFWCLGLCLFAFLTFFFKLCYYGGCCCWSLLLTGSELIRWVWNWLKVSV